jgi:CheY-like chemotaxis protein
MNFGSSIHHDCARTIRNYNTMSQFQILIVEDEAILAMNEQKLLQRMGYQVCGVTNNGKTAVEIARSRAPDLILMDIRIRGPIDGIQTAGRIRRFSDVPVLYTSAYSDEDTLIRLRNTPFSRHLFKPYQVEDLQEAIEAFRTESRWKASKKNQGSHAPANEDASQNRLRWCLAKEE